MQNFILFLKDLFPYLEITSINLSDLQKNHVQFSKQIIQTADYCGLAYPATGIIKNNKLEWLEKENLNYKISDCFHSKRYVRIELENKYGQNEKKCWEIICRNFLNLKLETSKISKTDLALLIEFFKYALFFSKKYLHLFPDYSYIGKKRFNTLITTSNLSINCLTNNSNLIINMFELNLLCMVVTTYEGSDLQTILKNQNISINLFHHDKMCIFVNNSIFDLFEIYENCF